MTSDEVNVASPYNKEKHPLMDDAWQKGRRARLAKQPKAACPFGDYPGKQFRRAWFEGWDAGAPIVVVQEVQVRVQVPRVMTPGSMWPKGTPLPTHYHRPRVLPCPKCLRLRTERDAQAVVVKFTFKKAGYEFASLLCRACDHAFILPVEGP